jgi:hypothetical protein
MAFRMRDIDYRQLAWLLSRLATYPFRALRNDLRIRKAVREFDAVMSDPFAPVTEVWVRARAVHWAYNFAMAPRRWQQESYRAARVASEIKRQTGNRILLWVLFPELGP